MGVCDPHMCASIDHTSYFEWGGQLFNAITVKNCCGRYRSSGICYVHIRNNGELVTDRMIVEYGMGRYDSDWNRIEAEWFMRGENIHKSENEGMPGFPVVCYEEAVLTYPKVKGCVQKHRNFIAYYIKNNIIIEQTKHKLFN